MKILEEWHPTKNGELQPTDVSRSSKRKVWWLGKCGHEWESAVYVRVAGSDCPYCSNRAILEGFNDLATTHPEVAKQWHPTKNGELQPTAVSKGTDKKIWWQCEQGHEWEAKIYSRVHGKGCPYCGNKAVLKGYNDLATTHPDVAEQWHPTKNGDLRPTDVLGGARKKVWWVCEKKHEWETAIFYRAAGSNCPYCSNQALLPGFNDLATTHPILAFQWHPTKNGDLRPTDVLGGSRNRVWWLGPCGHEWQAKVYHRAEGTDCPYCLRPKKEKKSGR